MFSADEYKKVLRNIEQTICLKDYKNFNTGLILRHDVDESMDLAYDLFKIEKEMGIVSTYHLLLTSDLYNPFSKKNRKYIHEMIENGFEVGLHFDPTAYDVSLDEELMELFLGEVEMFEKYLEIPLYSYSMHQPSVTGIYINYEKLINAYGVDVFHVDRYISDSAFSFRGKSIIEYIEKSKNELIQMLIHADHVFSKGNKSYENCLNIMLKNYLKNIDSLYADNKLYMSQRDKYKIKVANG